mmetsp:Transcript_22683/g.53695  ORF Transcript_22683/g.53695 Transcript_22683/m.53695 type:complete len:207 (+) Transcript_22683:2279-2899(+)
MVSDISSVVFPFSATFSALSSSSPLSLVLLIFLLLFRFVSMRSFASAFSFHSFTRSSTDFESIFKGRSPYRGGSGGWTSFPSIAELSLSNLRTSLLHSLRRSFIRSKKSTQISFWAGDKVWCFPSRPLSSLFSSLSFSDTPLSSSPSSGFDDDGLSVFVLLSSAVFVVVVLLTSSISSSPSNRSRPDPMSRSTNSPHDSKTFCFAL